MRYSPPNPDINLSSRSCGAVIFTTLFSATFTLTLTLVIAPRYFRIHPGATLAGIIGLALIYSSYAMLVRGLRLPFLFHALVLLIFQWPGLFRICLEHGILPAGLLNPFALIKIQPLWFAVTMGGGVIALYFSNSLMDLQKIPKVIPPDHREILSETSHLSTSPWEQNWKSWRFGIFGAVIITAISYLVGYAYLDLKRSALWAGILLWLQLGLGVWLLLIGHFYYKRAVWKVGNLTPGPEMKRVWGRGLAVWFGVAALASLVLPVNWRLNQWWLLQLFQSLLRLLSGGRIQADLAPQLPDNSMKPQETLPPDSSWIIDLIRLLFTGMLLLMVVAGLLLLLFGIGYLLQRFYAKEAERLKGLPKALIKLYILWRDFWRGRRRGFIGKSRARGTMERGEPGQNEPAGKMPRGYSWGKGPRAVIRRGYYRLINSARVNGYAWRGNQTPQEIATDLNSILPESEEALSGIADSYQQARYGPKPPTGGLAQLFERLRREVQNRLQFLK